MVCVNSLCIHLKDAKEEEEEEKSSLNEIPFSLYMYIHGPTKASTRGHSKYK